MKVTQVVKYLYPVYGGMERVAEIISNALESAKIEEHRVFFLRDREHLKMIDIDAGTSLVTPLFYFRAQPISFLSGSIAMLKRMRKTDVIVIHSPLPNLEISLYFFSFFIKRRIICVMHADPKDTRWKKAQGILNFFYTQFFKRCESVVFTNELNATQSLIPCKRKVVINNGVKVVPGLRKQFQQKSLYDILYVGSFREYKGIRYLIDSLEFQKNIRLQLVGSGELLDAMKQYAAEKKVSDRVIFHGNISDEKLNGIYLASDLFVLPSINGSEAFGLVQVEAMAKGLPVINTDLETAVKLVSLDGVTGYTVKPMDAAALAEAIEKVLQPDVYEKFSASAIERATLFSADKMSEAYLDLILERPGAKL